MADSQCTQWLQPMPVYADTLNAMQEVAAPETPLVSNMWRLEKTGWQEMEKTYKLY